MNNLDENKINRKSAGNSTGGQFDHKAHAANDRVGLGGYAGEPDDNPGTKMVNRYVQYTIPGSLPTPRSRKVRREHVSERMELPVLSLTSEQAPLAVGEVRHHEGRFFKKVPESAISKERRNQWGAPCEEEVGASSSFTDYDMYQIPELTFEWERERIRQAAIEKEERKLAEFAYIDGEPYVECGEPHLSGTTFGFNVCWDLVDSHGLL